MEECSNACDQLCCAETLPVSHKLCNQGGHARSRLIRGICVRVRLAVSTYRHVLHDTGYCNVDLYGRSVWSFLEQDAAEGDGA